MALKIGVWFASEVRPAKSDMELLRDWVERVIEEALVDDGDEIVELSCEGLRYDGATIDVGPGVTRNRTRGCALKRG